MSTFSETIHGVGFSTKNIDNKYIVGFLIKHKNADTIRDFSKELTDILDSVSSANELTTDEMKTIIQTVNDYTDEFSCDMGFDVMLADIMCKETGISFSHYESSEYEGNKAVMFCEEYPWNFNNKERSLTLDSLKEIIFPYAKELGIAETIDDVDYEKVEITG